LPDKVPGLNLNNEKRFYFFKQLKRPMEEHSKKTPAPHGRATGIIYLLYFLAAIYAQTLPNATIWYFIVNLISCCFYFILTILFYNIFKSVDKTISLFAITFGFMGCVVTALGVFNIDPFNISPLLFFGPYCILIGYLIYRSVFLPRLLGVLMLFAGIGWLIFLSPFGKHLTLPLEILGILAEALLMLWLIIKGISNQKWRAQNAN
jgi:Domain of unknown function (DUF4386)